MLSAGSVGLVTLGDAQQRPSPHGQGQVGADWHGLQITAVPLFPPVLAPVHPFAASPIVKLVI